MTEAELAEIEKRWSSMGFSPGMAHLTTDIPCLIAEVRRLKEEANMQFRVRLAEAYDEAWNAAIEAAAEVVDTAGYKLCLDVNVPSGLGLTPIGQTLLDVKALKRPAEGGSDV